MARELGCHTYAHPCGHILHYLSGATLRFIYVLNCSSKANRSWRALIGQYSKHGGCHSKLDGLLETALDFSQFLLKVGTLQAYTIAGICRKVSKHKLHRLE